MTQGTRRFHFISGARLGIAREDYVESAPDLVVEVLSRTTREFDRITKRRAYARYGGTECRMVSRTR